MSSEEYYPLKALDLPAEYFRISCCTYDENVTVCLSSDGLTIQLGEKNGLVIHGEEILQIGFCRSQVGSLLISISGKCLDRLDSELEMDEPTKQKIVIVKLASHESLALTFLKEIFSSKMIDLDARDYNDAMETFLDCSDPKLLVYPPPKENVRSIQLNRNDYKTLSCTRPVNDVIIDFYLRFLQEETLTDDHNCYMFSSFFYNRLRTSGYAHVATWTRKINLFDKDFIIVPINLSKQWILAIICFPSIPKSRDTKKACILLFDCLATHPCWDDVADTLREYLANVYKTNDGIEINKENMPHYYVDVPQQDNAYDSGIFLLQYVEMFFKRPITDYTSLKSINKQLEDWFDRSEIKKKRTYLSKLIVRLVSQYNPRQIMPQIDMEVITLD